MSSHALPQQVARRAAVLRVVLSCVCGLILAFTLLRMYPSLGTIVGQERAHGPAVTLLLTLTVRSEENEAGSAGSEEDVVRRKEWKTAGERGDASYSRDAFRYQQIDADGNGCMIRDDILARDLTHIQFSKQKRCQVESGNLEDPYTGKTIAFQRGQATSSLVQIDHVVALHDAWNSGAKNWPVSKRTRFGNDPFNLLAVEGKANQDKSDKHAGKWLPSNKAYQCGYVARQIAIKAKYGLSVTAKEKQGMLRTLHYCPGQPLPRW
ncbi:HNH endonuclease family protein [Aeriscardovia aeriphila]|uniref:Deoxyribonuclease n=1 Tax=Aeriscardovia aeriphila TaxID=218139 RepID=A0A261FBF7_9BIFI|nr:HNH endonuclease family protein [Aeriscardovia aeriphila]NYI25384.1 hypothetical protein [Aeriscardovia aeriphila]OZG56462.1 deoxyribonuclease [Aeriscardovia aeriphila]